MNMTFKVGLLKEWTLLDDKIIIGEKIVLFSEITDVLHAPATILNNGIIQIHTGFGKWDFYTLAYKYSQSDRGSIAANYIIEKVKDNNKGFAKRREIVEKGFRKRCNVCGKIFCYTLEDLEESRRHAKNAAWSSISTIAGGLSGNYAAGATSNQSAQDELNRIVDYDKCPSCGSRDLVDITDEEIARINAGQNVQAPISSADELKKFKELLDMGVITQEEFDAKKKQLLGL